MSDPQTEKTTDRRGFLSRFGIVAAAVAGGAAAGAGAAAARNGGLEEKRLTIDVACLGNTWRMGQAQDFGDPTDFRAPFLVEGWIYPEGTIPADGFVPTPTGSTGRWVCRGWLVINNERPEPHAATTQDFVFGPTAEETLFQPDTLTSHGLEGTNDQERGMMRTVLGGTGRYFGAVGQAIQSNNGLNTTALNDGIGDPAPNFKFDFDLRLP